VTILGAVAWGAVALLGIAVVLALVETWRGRDD